MASASESEDEIKTLIEYPLIPEDTILYEDSTPFHKINMYKKLVAYHIAITTKVIVLNRIAAQFKQSEFIKTGKHYTGPIPRERDFTGSVPKVELIEEGYQNCEEEKLAITFPIEGELEFEHSYVYGDTYVWSAKERNSPFINLVSSKDYRKLFIVFGEGMRFEDMRALDKGVKVNEKTGQTIWTEREMVEEDVFRRFLVTIKGILLNPSLRQIILCGHSNGITQARITAFILLCIVKPEYRSKNEFELGKWTQLIEEFYEPEFGDILRSKTLFVVGTGGSPVLFSTPAKFKEFYDELKGRYVNILTAVRMSDEKIFIDHNGSPLMDLVNSKFCSYSIPYENIDKLNYSNRTQYRGVPCFYKVSISHDPDPEIWEIIDHENKRSIYRNKKTSQTLWPSQIGEIWNKNTFLDCDANNTLLENYKCKDLKFRLHQLYMYRQILSIYFFS